MRRRQWNLELRLTLKHLSGVFRVHWWQAVVILLSVVLVAVGHRLDLLRLPGSWQKMLECWQVRPMPSAALEGQVVAGECPGEGIAEAGGCWLPVSRTPPCGSFFYDLDATTCVSPLWRKDAGGPRPNASFIKEEVHE